MTELAVSVRLKADGSGLVGQLRNSTVEVGKLTAALAAAGVEARGLASASSTAQGGASAIGAAANDAAAGAEALGTAAGEATQAVAAIGAGAGAATADLSRLEAICADLRGGLGAVVTTGQQLVGAIAPLGAGMSELVATMQVATGVAGQLAAGQARVGTAVEAVGEGATVAVADLTRLEEVCANLGSELGAAGTRGAELAGELASVRAVVAELVGGVGAAAQAAERLASEQEQAGAAAAQAAAMSQQLADQTTRTSTAMNAYERELARLLAQIDPVGEAHRRMEEAVEFAREAFAKGDLTVEQYELALKRAEASVKSHAGSVGNMQIAQMELEHVVRATSDAIAAGEPIYRVLGMEMGRVAEAATLMGGAAGKFGEFMRGPWGIAISVGVATIAPLIGELLATNDALGEAIDKLKEDAEKTDATRKAKEAFGKTLEGVAAAIADQAAALDKSIASETSAAQRAYDLAKANLAKEVAIRAATAAQLEQAIVEANQERQAAQDEQRYGKSDVNSFRLPQAEGRVTQLQDQLAANNASLTQARTNLNNTQVDLVAEQAKIASDPIKALNKLFDDQEKAAKDAARGNAALTAGLRDQILAIEANRKAAVKAEEDKEHARKTRTPSLGSQIREEDGANLLASAQSYTGLDERKNTGQLEALFSKANEKVDPRMVAWCAAFVNAVLATNGLPGTGSLSARSFLTYGTATDKPEKGDIVVLGRGNDPLKGHVGFYAGQDKNGRIEVTGGNQGNKVSTESFARSDVLAFRRAPTAAQAQKADDEAAKKTAEAYKKAGDELDRINLTWNEQPKLIDRAASDTKKLDDLIAEYSGKADEQSRAIVARAEAEKQAIEIGKTKPLADYVKQQSEELQVQQLILGGHQDEADALRTQIQLEKQMGPLTDQQKAAVLETAQAMAAEARAIDVMRERQQMYLDALGQMKGIVEDATQAFVRGDLGQLIKSPGKLLQAFQQLQGKQLFDKLFGDAFRDLEDQVTGREKVGNASELMAQAVDKVTAQTKRTTGALGDLETAAGNAAKAVAGANPTAAPVPAALTDATLGLPTQIDVLGMLDKLPRTPVIGAGGEGDSGSPSDANGDIVVTGKRQSAIDISSLLPSGNLPDFAKLASALDRSSKSNPQELFASGLGKVATSVASIFTNRDSAETIGKSIGTFAGKGLAGAATGSLVSGLANSAGLHLNQTGAQIGGAIGSFVPIPGGQIIGSVLGGLVGDLFAPKAHPGGTSVSLVDGQAAVSGNVGSDKAGIAEGNTLGAKVADGINQIASQLGGTLGSFSVQIGEYKKDLRVNTNGKALGGVSGSGAASFGTDEGAAVSYAISQAVAQGAVTGLSSAVTKALQSSTDVDKALQEALKVSDLEKLIGGIGAQLDGVFKDEAAKAADRVTLAKKYGLDLLATEKANAEERADLVASTLKSSVGSLQDLLTSLQTGDLFEGDAATRRKALQTKITAAEADAEAGKAGAADTLAQLEQQLIQTSKEAYGTAGPEYGADRDSAVAEIQKVIDLATQRVNAAAGNNPVASDAIAATTDAVNTGNALTNESNDLLAQVNSKLGTLIDTTAASTAVAAGAAGVLTPGLWSSATARFAELT